MKYLVLLVKAIIAAVLLMHRLEEIDLLSWLPAGKVRNNYNYYFDTAAGVVIFLILLDFMQVIIVWFYRRRHHKMRGEDNFTIGMGHIYTILVYAGVIVGLLTMARLQIKEVFTSLSIIFAGLAILSKEYVSNLINGMIITFAGHLSIGDNVKIGEHRGKIIDITLQNIHLLNDDDDIIYIPNLLVFTAEVINYTKRIVKRTSIDFEIDLKYLQNVDELERILIETLRPYHEMIKENSYYLRVAEVKKDLVLLKFQYILNEPNKELEREIRRKTIRKTVEIISNRQKFVDKTEDLPATTSEDEFF